MSNKTSVASDLLSELEHPSLSKVVKSQYVDPERETLSVKEQLLALRPKGTPEWVRLIRPLNPPTDGTNGLHRLVGMWPGDETDDEVELLLKQIDDEDAGRA